MWEGKRWLISIISKEAIPRNTEMSMKESLGAKLHWMWKQIKKVWAMPIVANHPHGVIGPCINEKVDDQ